MIKNNSLKNKITVYNFVLSILVIFIHSYNIEYFENTPEICMYIETVFSYTLGGLAVPGFFVLSSYLFFRKYDPSKLWGKYKKRTKSILIPYLLWNTIYFSIFFVLTNITFTKMLIATEPVNLTIGNFIESVLFRKYNLVFWFMQQLIYFVILTPIVYFIIQRKLGIIFIIILWFLGLKYPLLPDTIYGIRIDMLVYWLIGGIIATCFPMYIEKKKSKKVINLIAIIFFFILCIRFALKIYENSSGGEDFHFLQKLFLLLNVLLLWWTLDLFSYKNTKVFWWMEITFFYYATHPLLTDILKKLGGKFIPATPIGVLMLYFMGVIFCVFLIACLARILNFVAPPLWNILNGGRRSNLTGVKEKQ